MIRRALCLESNRSIAKSNRVATYNRSRVVAIGGDSDGSAGPDAVMARLTLKGNTGG